MSYPRKGRRYPKRYPPKRRSAHSRGVARISLRFDAGLKSIAKTIGVPEAVPFVPDAYQTEAIARVAGGDCLVTAPTGAGKTWIAREAMQRVIKGGGRCWYASPLKALSNAKYQEFGAHFGRGRVGIITGDRRENTTAPIIVGTTEILRNQLYDAMSAGETLAVNLVVLDEAHYLGDPQRGVVWEEIIIYLPPRITLLLLSATMGNAPRLTEWLASVRQRRCEWVRTSERPVPLEPLVLHPSGTLLPLFGKSASRGKTRNSAAGGTKRKKSKLHRQVRQLVTAARPLQFKSIWGLPPFGQILRQMSKLKLTPAIFFLKSRKDCDLALAVCARELGAGRVPHPKLSARLDELLADHPFLKRHRHRRYLEHYGVGAHHSGHLPAWKLVLETLMAEGLLQGIFATSTVAAGINVPARSVVFLNTDRFNGREFAPLTATEFHQMTGRAGRRGMDRVGFAVGLPGRFMDLSAYARLVRAPAGNITSQIQISFSMVLNLLDSHPPDQVEDLLARSFAAYTRKQTMPKQKRSPAAFKPDRASPPELIDSFRRHVRFFTGIQVCGFRGTPFSRRPMGCATAGGSASHDCGSLSARCHAGSRS